MYEHCIKALFKEYEEQIRETDSLKDELDGLDKRFETAKRNYTHAKAAADQKLEQLEAKMSETKKAMQLLAEEGKVKKKDLKV